MKKLAAIIVLVLLMGTPGIGQDLMQNLIVMKGLREVSASGSFKVVLIQGYREGIWFEGGIDGSEGIQYKFKRGRVTIRKRTKDMEENIQTVYVYYSQLSKINASGNVIIGSENRIEAQRLTIYASGSAFVSLELKVEYLKADLNGQARVSMRGNCTRQVITADGISKYYGYDLYSMDAVCWGELDAEIRVHVYRELRTNGHYNIHYIGNPASVDGMNSSRY